MKAKPIIFSSGMVRAILEGRKTQTRRVIKPQPEPVEKEYQWRTDCKAYGDPPHWWASNMACTMLGVNEMSWACPYGRKGDLLWVRETLGNDGDGDWWYEANTEYLDVICPEIWLKNNANKGKIPSIFMPKWASRITLEITDIRVERVQNISEEDARAEGIIQRPAAANNPFEAGASNVRLSETEIIPAKYDFQILWDSINGKDDAKCWDANPWVWVIEFKAHQKNVDEVV